MYQRRYNTTLIAYVTITLSVFFLLTAYFLQQQQQQLAASTSEPEDVVIENQVGLEKDDSASLTFIELFDQDLWTTSFDRFSVYVSDDEDASKSTYRAERVERQFGTTTLHRPVNDIYKLSSVNSLGQRNESFERTIVVAQQFTHDELQLVRRETLQMYLWDSATLHWIPLPTTIDVERGIAFAEVEELGIFSLRGDHVQ